MSMEAALGLYQQMFWTTIQIASPVLIVGLVVGGLVSILQAATQVQEQSISFMAKAIAMVGVLCLCGGWMLTRLMDFTRMLFESLPGILR